MSANVVLLNSVISDMSGGFLLIMFLYLWLMLLLVVGWITATHFSGASPSSICVNCIQNCIKHQSIYQYNSYMLKKLHWFPVEQHSVHDSHTCLQVSSHRFFTGILLHIFLPTSVLTVPGAVKVVVISLPFQSSTLLFINLSNSLVIVLLLMLCGTVWNALPDEIRAMPSLASFRKQLKIYLYTKAHPP